MARLPEPGSDGGVWGGILNEYLKVSHDDEGRLNSNVVGDAQIQSGSITKAKLSSSVQQSLDNADAAAEGTIADNSITTAKLQNGAVTNAKLDSPTQSTLSAVSGKYVKPGGGIPVTDLESDAQDAIGDVAGKYTKPGSGIPIEDLESDVQDAISEVADKYTKPNDGIPLTDLDEDVQSAIANGGGDGNFTVALYDFDNDEYPDRPDAIIVRWIGPTQPTGWIDFDEWREVEAPADVPDAPTNVTAVAGDAIVDLEWDAPASDGGAAIVGYIITPYIGASAEPAFPIGNVTSYQVTGLTNDTTYTFRVAAVNSAGTGPDSSASNSVTPAGAAVSAPTIVQTSPIAEGGSGTMSVTATLGVNPTPGNRLVATQYSWQSTANTPIPSGWSEVDVRTNGNVVARILTRVVQSGDPAAYTFTTSVGIHQGVIIYELTPSSVEAHLNASATTTTSFTFGPTADPVPEVLPIAVTTLSGQNEVWIFPGGWSANTGTRFTSAIGPVTDGPTSVTVTKAVARSCFAVLATFRGGS